MTEQASTAQTSGVETKRKPGILFTILGLVIGAGAGVVLDSVSLTWGAGVGIIAGLLLDFLRKNKKR